jgi:PAS domain S-box-containing protein
MSILARRLSRLPTGWLVTIFLLLTGLPILALAYVSISLGSAAVSRESDARVADTAALSAALVGEELRGVEDLVQSYATRPTFVDAMGQGDPRRYNLATLHDQLTQLSLAHRGTAATFVSDASGRIIDAEPATPAIIGQDFSFRDWYKGVQATGKPYVSEAYVSAITGNPRVIAVAAPVPAPDGSGRTVGILVSAYDVTALEQFVDGFAKVQGIGVVTTDQRGVVVAAPGGLAPGLVSATGDARVRAALAGKSGVVHIGGQRGVVSGYAPVPSIGWTVRTEVPNARIQAALNTITGTFLAVAAVLFLIVIAAVALLVSTLRLRRQDEAALAVGQQRAAEADALFTLSLDMIAVAGTDGYFKRLNPSWSVSLGWTDEELLAEPFIAFVHPDDRAATEAEAAKLAGGGSTLFFENRYRHADGSYRTLSWTATASPDLDLIYAVARDISEQKEHEERLRRAESAALEAARLKSEFLANMSHEIRTPMNGVIGMTDLLLGTSLVAEQREFAETIRRSGEALLSVINDVLDFSKIESGKLQIESIEFDVRTVVEDVAEMIAGAAHSKGLELAAIIPPELPTTVMGDPSRLRQILLNLAANAVKFTQTGEIVIRAGRNGDVDSLVTLRFEVTDTGVGLDAETLGRLFTPFTQADASTTRKYGGSGLGLAIAKQLVDLMGGEIGVESEPGKGSVFWFTVRVGIGTGLPVQAQDPARSLADVRVLVVDDNDTNRRILERSLLTWGSRALVASDGPQALAILREAVAAGDPVLVGLLDFDMPGMDGLELARQIRADPAIADVHLVLLTSASHRSGLGASAGAGFDAHLTKPVRQSALYECLRTVLGRQKSRRRRPLVTSQAMADFKAAGRAHLLVVEDNQVNQKVAAGMLKKLGFRVDVAANGAEAVEAVSQRRYAAVLMDCQMPVLDGYEATGEIRRGESPGSHLPIIAMTAGALDSDRDRCLAAGMDDYITKPVRAEKLAEVLANWIIREPGLAPPAPPSTEVEPDLFARWTELADMVGLEAAGGIIRMFMEDGAAQLTALHEAFDARDYAAIGRLAHGMRGSAATVGLTGVATICNEVEAAARQEARTELAAAMSLLDVELDRVPAALGAFIAITPV